MGKPTMIVLLREHSNRMISDDGALLYADHRVAAW